MLWHRRAIQFTSVALVAAVFLATLPLAPVFATEVDELRDAIEAKNAQIKAIEDKIKTYEKTIKQKQLERVSLNNQVGLIDDRIAKAELDIDSTGIQVEQINLELDALDYALEQKAQDIIAHKGNIADFIRLIHMNDQKSSIEILAGYKSITDFAADVQTTKMLHSTLSDSAKLLQKAKIELEEQKEEQEERKTALQDLSELLAVKRQELSNQKGIKLSLIDQTASSEKKFQGLVKNLRSEYESIEGDIVSIERQIRQKLEGEDAFAGTGDQTFIWPVPSKYVTAYFHDPDYPYRHVFEHPAIDIRAGQGTPIKAAHSGFVARTRHCSSHLCYSYTVIVGQNQLSTVYGHMSQIYEKEGAFVTQGTVIGLSGGTPGTVGAGPFVTGPHLHFETRVNGIPVNPLNYLP